MTTVSIRLDDEDKKELEEICSEMGMNLSTFYMIYTKKVLRDRCIPFEISAPQPAFYSEQNLRQIRKADTQIQAGHTVEKSMDELDALADNADSQTM